MASSDTALGNHDQLLALRERMRVRAIGLRADESSHDVGSIPVLTFEPDVPAAHAPTPVSLPPANVLSDLKRAQALRERVLSRGAPSAQHASNASAGPNKDLYPHEQPFPVNTVFEVERVHSSAHSHDISRPEVLLMAAESASVLKAVETRLGEETSQRLQLEKKLAALDAEFTKVKAEKDELKKHDDAGKARIVEMTAEIEKLKKDHQTTLDALKKEKDTAIDTVKKEADAKAKNDLKDALEAQKKATDAAVQAQLDMKTFEALVVEMREQLHSNGLALQNQTLTIRHLTEDLLGAKAQVTNLSVALNEKDKETRNLRADLHSIQTKSHKAVETEKEAEALRVEVEALKREVAKLKAIAETVPALQAERDKLAAANTKYESDVAGKNSELARLRAQVEAVRSQADAAYLHSSQFHQTGAAGGMGAATGAGGGSAGLYGMAAPPPGAYGVASSAAEAIRREIEEEERRTAEEQRRWRQKQVRS